MRSHLVRQFENRGRVVALTALGTTLLFAQPVLAADKAPPAPVSWWDSVKVTGIVEGGFTGNPDNPVNNLNFGHLFTDKANVPLFNQGILTIERALDPKATGYDFGFKLQGLFGSDARYTHFLGEFTHAIDSRYQVDIVEAYLSAHLPWLTSGGIDVKAGHYVTLEGIEVITAPDNLLYSHSYIFNFGIPLKHTGVMTTTHLNSVVDIYAGVDTGVNTSLGKGDNNDAAAFHGGIGLNLLDGALTILATTHIGAENPEKVLGDTVNGKMRYLNDIAITWKANEKWTFMTDLNYIRDDLLVAPKVAEGFGIAQYFSYQYNDWLKIVGRGEVWRDVSGVFVAAFPGKFDFVNAEVGNPATVIGGGKTTYGALTFGLNIKAPTFKPFTEITFRPEVRYDASLNNTKPFKDGTKAQQWTIGGDLVARF